MLKTNEHYEAQVEALRGRLIFKINDFLTMPETYKDFAIRHGHDEVVMRGICVEVMMADDSQDPLDEWKRHIASFYLGRDLLAMLDCWVACGRDDLLTKLTWKGD